MKRTVLAVTALAFTLLVPLFFTACSGSKGTPTTPTTPPPPTPTKIIKLYGNLSFGSVNVGSFVDRTLMITNSGNTTLTVTSMTVTGASGTLTASWTSGTIAPGGTQNTTVRFAPTSGQSYSGVVTVACDSTTGMNTANWSGTGVDRRSAVD